MTVTFHLKLGGQTIRRLEEIPPDVSDQELLAYHQTDLLAEWLAQIGEAGKASQVRQVSDLSSAGARRLRRILLPAVAPESAPPSPPLTEVEEYYAAYQALLDQPGTRPGDPSHVRKCLDRIAADYLPLFERGTWPFYRQMAEEAPLAILLALAHEKLRPALLPDPWVCEDLWRACEGVYPVEPKQMLTLERIKYFIREQRGSTDGHWRTLAVKSIRCLVLYMSAKTPLLQVRPAEQVGPVLGSEDVRNQLPVLHGLEAMVSHENTRTCWMEVDR